MLPVCRRIILYIVQIQVVRRVVVVVVEILYIIVILYFKFTIEFLKTSKYILHHGDIKSIQ
jgi:hypothetical protein